MLSVLSVRYLIFSARLKDGKKATRRIKALEQISMYERALLTTKHTAVDAQRTLIDELDKAIASREVLLGILSFIMDYWLQNLIARSAIITLNSRGVV